MYGYVTRQAKKGISEVKQRDWQLYLYNASLSIRAFLAANLFWYNTSISSAAFHLPFPAHHFNSELVVLQLRLLPQGERDWCGHMLC